jgi:hypothetical protein
MLKRRLGVLVLVAAVLSTMVPTMLAPVPAQAAGGEPIELGWFVYTPNHPNGCAPLPWDCFVVQIY